jgi:hypothetical protein
MQQGGQQLWATMTMAIESMGKHSDESSVMREHLTKHRVVASKSPLQT